MTELRDDRLPHNNDDQHTDAAPAVTESVYRFRSRHHLAGAGIPILRPQFSPLWVER